MTTLVLVLLAVLVVGLAVAFLLRRRFLLGLGAVTVWLRPAQSPRWSVGVTALRDVLLWWYRGLSLSVRPQERFCRPELRVESCRALGRDDLSLPLGRRRPHLCHPRGAAGPGRRPVDGDGFPLLDGVAGAALGG